MVMVLCIKQQLSNIWSSPHEKVEVPATDMRYFARSKLSGSLIYKNNISLMWEVVFKLGYLEDFVTRGRIPLLSLNKLGEKLQGTIILG